MNAVAQLGIDQACEVLDGPAARAIVREAKAIDAELVVVATHVATRARTRAVRAVIGSVAADVARSAPCSVLVVRAQSFRRAVPAA